MMQDGTARGSERIISRVPPTLVTLSLSYGTMKLTSAAQW